MRNLIVIILAVFAAAACEDTSCHFNDENLVPGVTEGGIEKLFLRCGDEAAFSDSITIESSDPVIASTRRTRGDVGKGDKGYYLLAHSPGTVTLTAMKKGKRVAQTTATVRPQ